MPCLRQDSHYVHTSVFQWAFAEEQVELPLSFPVCTVLGTGVAVLYSIVDVIGNVGLI